MKILLVNQTTKNGIQNQGLPAKLSENKDNENICPKNLKTDDRDLQKKCKNAKIGNNFLVLKSKTSLLAATASGHKRKATITRNKDCEWLRKCKTDLQAVEFR